MVFIGRSSHYADTFTAVRTLAEKNVQFRLSSDRLNNARRFPELSDYRTDLPELLSHSTRIERSERNTQRLEKVLTITRAYDQALGLDEGGLQSQIAPLLAIVREGLQPDVDVARWRQRYDGNDNFDNRLRAIRALLNTRVGQRYIFAGSRYTQPPVRDLTEPRFARLAPPSPSVPPPSPSDSTPYEAFLERNGRLENFVDNGVAEHDAQYDERYDAQSDRSVVPAAHQRSLLQVSEGQKISYGVSSNERAINEILLAARLIRRALESTDESTDAADRQQFLQNARTLLEDGEIDLRELRQRAAAVIPDIQLAQERERSLVSLTQTLVSRLTYFDSNQAGVELAALTTQFSATLRTVQIRQRLSIVNFL